MCRDRSFRGHLAADLAARSDLLRVEHRLRQDPSIAMLVNNAGIAVAGPMHGSDLDRLEAMVNINIMAALRLAHAAVDGFMARGRGTLINVSSVLALAPEQFNAIYSGTKSFMLNFSMALQTELANPGIRVQAVLPGATLDRTLGKAASMSRRCRRQAAGLGDLLDVVLVFNIGEAVKTQHRHGEWLFFNYSMCSRLITGTRRWQHDAARRGQQRCTMELAHAYQPQKAVAEKGFYENEKAPQPLQCEWWCKHRQSYISMTKLFIRSWRPRRDRSPASALLLAAILTIGIGARQSFGIFEKRIAADLKVGRELCLSLMRSRCC